MGLFWGLPSNRTLSSHLITAPGGSVTSPGRARSLGKKVYGLTGKSDTDDLELVTLAYVDGGALTAAAEATQAERQLQTESAIAELSILIAAMGGTSDV